MGLLTIKVPVTTEILFVTNGPGMKRLFEASTEKNKMGYAEPHGPILKYTVENPLTMEPMVVNIEMIGNWKRIGYLYVLDGCLDGQFVTVKDWLNKDDTGYRGSITRI